MAGFPALPPPPSQGRTDRSAPTRKPPRRCNGRRHGTTTLEVVMPRKYTRRPLAERFWEKVEKTDTCWLWRARTMPRGYGVVGIGTGKTFLAHRVAYEL